jgi:hypothetical protein
MRVRRLGPALAAALLAGCAGAQRTRVAPAAASSPAPAADTALARRLCDALHTLPAQRRKECCPQASEISLAEVCTSELTAALKRGSVTLDAEAIGRCEAATARRLEGCDWVTPVQPPLPEECSALIRGRLAAGTACVSSLECADGLFCRGAASVRAGVCAPPAPARAPCAVPFDNLASFARGQDDPRHRDCEGRCFKGQCYPPALVGQECISTAFCQTGLSCVGGRCREKQPLPRVGEACAKTTGCSAGAYCADEGVCALLKGVGEPCSGSFECRAFGCLKPEGAATGVCADPCLVAPPGGSQAPLASGSGTD